MYRATVQLGTKIRPMHTLSRSTNRFNAIKTNELRKLDIVYLLDFPMSNIVNWNENHCTVVLIMRPANN